MSKMVSSFYLQSDPLRPLDWRSGRARQILEGRPRWLGRQDDAVIAEMVRFLQRRDRCETIRESHRLLRGHARGVPRFPDP